MLDEPYRWIEAVRNRREYLQDQLTGASPVVACRYTEGLLLLTATPGPRKIFEVYNQIAFAGVGHPADIEKLRKAVIDIAHMEAFNLSAADVSLQRLVNFGVGPLMKTAFDEVFHSPYIARVLVAELDPADPQETFYTVDADGSFAGWAEAAAIAGSASVADAVRARLSDGAEPAPLDAALVAALRAWGAGLVCRAQGEAEAAAEASPGEIAAALEAALEQVRLEAAVLDRSVATKTRFRRLDPQTLEAAVAAVRG